MAAVVLVVVVDLMHRCSQEAEALRVKSGGMRVWSCHLIRSCLRDIYLMYNGNDNRRLIWCIPTFGSQNNEDLELKKRNVIAVFARNLCEKAN